MGKKYWKSIDELATKPVSDEGNQGGGISPNLMELVSEKLKGKPSSRRNFLKFCGFSFATAAITASCKNPIETAIPYLIKPEEVTPGMALHYASTYFDGHDYNAVLVKVRDGRPIKIEGNDLSPISRGKASARVQASVLSLYDDGSRYKSPVLHGKNTSWVEVDKEVMSKLSDVVTSGKGIAIITSTIISPSTLSVIGDFIKKYPATRHITYDAISCSTMLDANNITFGERSIPGYHFDKADIIVSFGADFLGTWLSPVEYAGQFAETRRLSESKKNMSQLYVFESTLTITGANADYRFPVKPSRIPVILLNLYNEIAARTGAATFAAPPSPVDVKTLATHLVKADGKSLIVCGDNNNASQILVNAINYLLHNYGNTLDFETPLLIRKGSDMEMDKLLDEATKGKIGAMLFLNCNPVYDCAESERLVKAMDSTDLTVSFATARNETSRLCQVVAPDHHYLESFNDAEPKLGIFSLQQPVIPNIYDTRQVQDSLLKWSGGGQAYHEYLKQYWQQNLFSKQEEFVVFDDFWTHTLQKGVFEVKAAGRSSLTYSAAPIPDAARQSGEVTDSDTEIFYYETIALGSGLHTNNPWLMELPDPISKVCWDHFAAIPPSMAKKLNAINGDLLHIAEGIELPAYILPGQAEGTIGIAIGYGRRHTGKVADGVGVNVFPGMKTAGDYRKNYSVGEKVSNTGRQFPLACSQAHYSMEGRNIVRETTLSRWIEKPESGNEMHFDFETQHRTLYKEFKFEGHHWGMAVDLNRCTGCSACVIACQAENNVPVVGKEQVLLTRAMHWIRIDRYFSEDTANPSVYFQPVMCQHCDNAPCENVCPVSATNHSNEGLNQIAYNRCIGTKYCINNCPYKVRRFNWFRYATNPAFDYNLNSDLGRMVLNPDVTVRERGVVEKCSLCVQRIQEKKLEAKLENRMLKDGEILPACAQTCPAGAIIFGDLNDTESNLSKIYKDKRKYHLVEEIHTLPKVGYLTKVRNRS